MMAALMPPIEMPAIQCGCMPDSAKASYTPAWYAPSAPPPCNTEATRSKGRGRPTASRFGLL